MYQLVHGGKNVLSYKRPVSEIGGISVNSPSISAGTVASPGRSIVSGSSSSPSAGLRCRIGLHGGRRWLGGTELCPCPRLIGGGPVRVAGITVEAAGLLAGLGLAEDRPAILGRRQQRNIRPAKIAVAERGVACGIARIARCRSGPARAGQRQHPSRRPTAAKDEVPEQILLRIHIGARGAAMPCWDVCPQCFLCTFLDGAGEPLLRGPCRPANIPACLLPGSRSCPWWRAHRSWDGLPRRGLGFCQTRQLCRRLVWRQSLIQQRAEQPASPRWRQGNLALAAPSGLHGNPDRIVRPRPPPQARP